MTVVNRSRLLTEIDRGLARWGKFIREAPNGYSSRNVLDKIRTEGTGSGHRSVINAAMAPLPVKEFPQPAWVHRAWLVMPFYDVRTALWVYYSVQAPAGEKAKALGIKKDAFYQRRLYGLFFLAGQHPAQQSGKVSRN